jgi:hypothetical protein
MRNQELSGLYYTIEGDLVDKATYEGLGERQGLTKGAFESYLSKVLAGDAKGITAAQAALISEGEDTSQILNRVDLSNVVPGPQSIEEALANAVAASAEEANRQQAR